MKDVKITKNVLIFVLACAVSTFAVFMGYTAGLPEYLDAVIMPFEEFSNAKTAYEYHIEMTNCTGHNCGPSCSLQARIWIDEYRDDHNLTYNEFLCAVWFNDQSDWFYY